MSYIAPKFFAPTRLTISTMSEGRLKTKPGSNSQVTLMPMSPAILQTSCQALTTLSIASFLSTPFSRMSGGWTVSTRKRSIPRSFVNSRFFFTMAR